MNTNRLLAVLLVTHMTTAAVAWLNGWLVGRFLERRQWEAYALFDALDQDFADFVDLVEPEPAYDWQRDGEAVETR